jgi:hypothetical protein
VCTSNPGTGLRVSAHRHGHLEGLTHQGCLHVSGSTAQPTTFRENRSTTTARYSQPVAVRMYVMSPAQAWLARAGANARLSTLSATGRLCLLSVVWTNLRRQHARSPWRRMRVRALWRPTCQAGVFERRAQAARAVRTPAGSKGRLQLHGLWAHGTGLGLTGAGAVQSLSGSRQRARLSWLTGVWVVTALTTALSTESVSSACIT